MTAIVGLFCTDGVVIGADSSVTIAAAGNFRTIEQQSNKIHIVEGRVIIAGTGPVGLGQRFCATVEKAGGLKGTPIEAMKQLCKGGIEDFAQTGLQLGTIPYGALVAFPVQNHPYLCEFETGNFQPELKTKEIWFGSMGNHQHITDAFLGLMKDVFWPNSQPSLQDGIFAAMWTLEHVVALNTGGVKDPIHIALLETKDGRAKARVLDDTELAQHKQNVAEAKEHMRNFRDKFQPGAVSTAPDVPKPG
jgi:hypothetical protein